MDWMLTQLAELMKYDSQIAYVESDVTHFTSEEKDFILSELRRRRELSAREIRACVIENKKYY